MAKINLLPWRLERRKQKQTEFLSTLGFSAAGAIAISVLAYMYYSGMIDNQVARNSYLNTEITKVKKENEEIAELEAKRNNLLKKKEVIESLQADRTQNVRLFDELVKSIPDGVRLTAIKQTGTDLTLDGRSQSYARVSSYMRNLEASGWMKNPDLTVIEAAKEATKRDAGLPYEFTLQVQLTKPGDEGNEEMLAPEAETPAAASDPSPAQPAPYEAQPKTETIPVTGGQS